MRQPLFAGLSDEDWLALNASAPSVEEDGASSVVGLPLVPDDAAQIRFSDLTGLANLRQAFSFYGFCRSLVQESGPLLPDDRILDFGCGWGRIARFWLRDVAPESLWCVDVLPDAIELLNDTLMPGNIVRSKPLPPVSGLPTEFRLIHAYSVFSHLSEDAAHRWVAYFRGLLKPGGLLVFTTRGRPFIDALREMQENPSGGAYHRYLAEIAPPSEEIERRHAAGEFVYISLGDLSPELQADIYGEAVIPRDYARQFERHGLTLRAFREDVPDVEQPAIVLQRPADAPAAAVRAIAFYLPQFHAIPENDTWWGQGFTDWHNVARGRPLYRGHYQPHLPGELGFYDLGDPEVRERQADLARAYGMSAFCYYHYWFKGRRLLERPFSEVLESGAPDFPFCLCWANEKWTRVWDGTSGETLIEQDYSEEDDRNHIHWLANAFRDERYLRVDGKPLFLVYRARNMPDPLATTLTWRREARELGVGELFLARVQSFPDEHDDPRSIGFDAAVEFAPDGVNLPPPIRRGRLWSLAARLGLASPAFAKHKVLRYDQLAERALAKPRSPYLRVPCVTPSWDNSPRRRLGGGWIVTGSTPELYERWLEATALGAGNEQGDDALVFVNAWNEWAEGNHLEPSERWGRAYLEATRRALESVSSGLPSPAEPLPSLVRSGAGRSARIAATAAARVKRDAT